jgi:hypothetical protein
MQRIALQAANRQSYVNKREDGTHEDTVRCLDCKCGEVSDRNASETISITIIHLGQLASTGEKMVD